MTIEFKAVFIRGPKKAKSNNWQETAHEWEVFINGQSFSYFTGLAHRKFSREGYHKLLMNFGYSPNKISEQAFMQKYNHQCFMEVTKPTPPQLDDALECLISDASACDQSFDDWCSELGYDTDSRNALETYLQCQENAVKLRKAKINIEQEHQRLQERA